VRRCLRVRFSGNNFETRKYLFSYRLIVKGAVDDCVDIICETCNLGLRLQGEKWRAGHPKTTSTTTITIITNNIVCEARDVGLGLWDERR
jgi:hypothetical protein